MIEQCQKAVEKGWTVWTIIKSRTFQRTTIAGAAMLALLWGFDAVTITDFVDGAVKILLSVLALENIIWDEDHRSYK